MMIRWTSGLALLALASVVTVHGPARGQAGVRADVTYIDPKTGEEENANFAVKSETPAGIELVTGGGDKVYSPDQIVDVTYTGLPGITLDTMTRLGSLEKSDPAKAAQEYADLAAKANGATKRILEFRAAMSRLEATNEKTGSAFEAEATGTADQLTTVATDHMTSWETWPATRAAARIRLELGQYEQAGELYSKLAAIPGLPADLRRKARLAQAGAMLRANKSADAKSILGELAGEADYPKSGTLREMLSIYQVAVDAPEPTTAPDGKPARPAEFVAKLENVIAGATDPAARAVGYGVLGDLYAAHGFPREAMWSYLWVDVVYPENRDEQVIAVQRLATVFAAIGEKERAEEYRGRMPTVR